MARTSTRRWKGCQLCKSHKHAALGDAQRAPWSVLRQLGTKRRLSRNQLTRRGIE